MKTDKELALRMLDAIENLFVENSVMKLVLKEKGWHSLEKVLAEAKADPKATGRVRQLFVPVRERILQDIGLEEVIQEFLKVVPPRKDLN